MTFNVGDLVHKPQGYSFDSWVVAVFTNRKGETRLVCEDDRGLLHIFNEEQMKRGIEYVHISDRTEFDRRPLCRHEYIGHEGECEPSSPERDFGYEAQKAAEAHLLAIEEAEENDTESPALGIWCGCDTCVIREILFAAWPIMQASMEPYESELP